jgi:tetratricopeptide (TPR) repeat protein
MNYFRGREGKSMTLTNNDFLSFGALLRSFRRRQSLTQQHLAEAMGVHRNAIGRWEQGDVLPGSKALVLELAKQLRLSNQEARHLLEASLTSLSPHWLVPFPRNPFFTGREEILESLHSHLGSQQAAALAQSYALSGLGGVGKTQIALEYAHRHALEYSAVFWIGAETVESIVASLLRIADVLQIPGYDDKDLQHVVGAVQRWLSTHEQWLLIWDNLEDLALLDRFLPARRQGAILLTTRRQALGTLAQRIDLLPMEQEEGVRFLLRRAKVLPANAIREQVRQFAEQMPPLYATAAELVAALAGLPLALDQTGAYLEETGCSLASYLRRYEQQQAQLLDRRGGPASAHPHSVTATFALTMEQVEREQPAAADILSVCALVQADAIPEELFLEGAPHLGPVLASLAADPAQFDQAIAVLKNLSLVQRQPKTQSLSLHRLVQAVGRERMGEQERALWQRRVNAALSAIFPEVTYEVWKQCERLLPHVLPCIAALPDHAAEPQIIEMVQRAADYLAQRFQLEQARSLLEHALHLWEQTVGPEHPDLVFSLHRLGTIFYEQGSYALAEPLFQRALHIQEHHWGAEHLQVVASLSLLGMLSCEQGNYAQAEPLQFRALSILERELGAEHARVANPLLRLGNVYYDQGNYALAEPLYQRALRIWEQQFGLEHPSVAIVLSDLAALFAQQKKDEQADCLYRRALRIWEQAAGADYVQVAFPLKGLAELYSRQGRYAEAESLFLRACRILEQVVGAEHPDLARTFNGLADLYAAQGNPQEAEPLYRRALSIREQRLGPQHPETRQALSHLALFQHKQGNLSEALSFAKQALSIRSQILGEAHPDTVAAHTLYTQFLQEQTGTQNTAAVAPVSSQSNPLQAFLAACCELHPRARCRSADLWHAYVHWAEQHHERFPLSRRDLTAQLQALGCQADRTNTTRLWRGIALVRQTRRQNVTEGDRT